MWVWSAHVMFLSIRSKLNSSITWQTGWDCEPWCPLPGPGWRGHCCGRTAGAPACLPPAWWFLTRTASLPTSNLTYFRDLAWWVVTDWMSGLTWEDSDEWWLWQRFWELRVWCEEPVIHMSHHVRSVYLYRTVGTSPLHFCTPVRNF